MKFAPTLSKYFLFATTLAVLLPVMPLSMNHAEAACTNWANEPDNDCDGLANSWEQNQSYTKNGITIPLTGANPDRRDIFIEIDYMSHHIPPAAAIDPVVARFNAFELQNPDFSWGVTLHYIIDDNVPHRTCIDVFSDIVPDPVIDSYDEYKESFFGTLSERNANSNVFEIKRDVYHYGLFIHTRCGSLTNQQSSGAAEWPGNDLEVSLGYPGWGNVDPVSGHDTGTNEYKGGTFMHELGHNLGLRHAGTTDLPHCKPNYLSVMNYGFQFPIFLTGTDWPMDYSHNVLSSLNESKLVESQGIGLAQPSSLKTAVGHTTPPTSHGSYAHYLKPTANNSPLSYNWYTGNSNTNEIRISSITNLHSTSCNDNDVQNTSVGGKLFGYDDVHYNSLIFWSNAVTFMNGTNNTLSGSIPVEGAPINGKIFQISSINPDSLQETPKVTISNQSDSQGDILNNPQLPPCDITIPGCQDSPCDEDDPYCKPIKEQNFTNPDAAFNDVGNRTDVPEITLNEVNNLITSKAIDINENVQSLNETQFVNGTDVQKLKMELENSLVNSSDSLFNLINSTKSDQALGKLFKLRSLVDGRGSNEIIQNPWNIDILEQIDNLILILQQKK